MSTEAVQLGSTANIVVTVREDDEAFAELQNATDLIIRVVKRSGVAVLVNGSFVTDGSDGLVQGTLDAGDNTCEGEARAQVTFTHGGKPYKSREDTFYVRANP